MINKRAERQNLKIKKSRFTIEKKMIAQVRYYETLYKIRDEKGEAIYTGSEETAKKILRILNSQGKSLKNLKRKL